MAWYAAGAALGFALPFVFTSIFDVHHDSYYAVYFAATMAFLAAYVRFTGVDVRDLFRRNWRWSAVLGAATAAFLVFNVLTRADSTPRPDGWYFAFTLGWRGVLYGAVDALLLSAFPLAVAYAAIPHPRTRAGAVGRGALVLVLMAFITAAYHLGYEQYRDDGVGAPEVGNTVITIPALLTGNPLGSVIAHVSMHVTADAHAYETDVYLPPQTSAD
jgi:hypothetical protein